MKKIGLLLSLMFPVFALALPTAKYTLKVINISAEPIEGALAMVTFSKPKLDTWGSVPYGKKGLTDSDGIFIAEGETEQFGTYGARKEGFYPTSYQYKKMTDVTGIIGFRRWQPWNPTLEVVLKKIKNPIAMYAYDTDWIELPKKGEFVGYDLIKQDWLVPYGKGVTADFLLRIISEERSRFDYTIDLELAFSNEVDGIQAFDIVTNGGSEFKSDHLAPAESYGRGLKYPLKFSYLVGGSTF